MILVILLTKTVRGDTLTTDVETHANEANEASEDNEEEDLPVTVLGPLPMDQAWLGRLV